MTTLLDAPTGPNPAKVEEFVDQQLTAARRRVRVLDYFMAGLALAVVSLAFLVGVLLVDRYVETPRGTGWAVLVAYLGLAAGFLYLTLFRASRRQINPYFAARQVEQTVPNAKNSLVTWVDFEEDQRLPGSIRTAIGQKAARDLKGVDLNRAIENRRVLWLAIAAGLFLIANVVIAFLPPTRTELTLEEPKKGDVTVFNNQEVTFQGYVRGRIPGPNDADAVRLRLWYNPDDPDTYEDRPLRATEDDRRRFALTIPPKQVRNGFQYKLLAGNAQTPTYTVTCKIIPEFTSFGVTYDYPQYLKRAPETTNDPNLIAPYGTTATLVALTNRDVKHGHIEIEGQTRTIDGQLIEGRPDAIQFTLTLEKEGFFRIWFTTPEGDKNQDPARLRIGVIDAKPVIRTFDIGYEYPKYLRYKAMKAPDVREPEIEAPRGTKIVLTAKTSRGVKDATLQLDGMPPIGGEPVPDQPMWVRFTLPPLDQDVTAKVTFTPTTSEGPSSPRLIPIRVLVDQAPQVEILEPKDEPKKEDVKQLPANGTLELKGLATDDHGVDKLTLRLKLIGSEDRDLMSKPYRGGMSFFRKEDNSWPTRVEYKDFVKLPDLRMDKNPNWRVGPGMEIEYWLEAKDNCTVPGPNYGESRHKRFRVAAPAAKPEEQQKINQQNRKADEKQKEHEKKQDTNNATENRDVKQEPPKGAEPPKDGNPQQDPKGPNGEPMPRKADGTPDTPPNPPDTPPEGDPSHEQQSEQVKNALNNAAKADQPGTVKPDTTPPPEAKVEPGDARQEPGKSPMSPPPAEDRTPKNNPNMDNMGEGPAGAPRTGNVDKSQDDKGSTKDKGDPMAGAGAEGAEKPSYGGGSADAAKTKPDTRKPTPKAGGSDQPTEPEKGAAHDQTPGPKDPGTGERRTPGETKPEKDVKSGAEKGPMGEPGGMSDTPPDAAAGKPQESPKPGGAKPEPKKEQVTDAGGSRGGPQDQDPAGGAQPMPKNDGAGDQQAKGGKKGGPGTPPPQNSEQGELDRELGELDREINSTNPKIDPRKKSSVEQLMRSPQTREKTRQKLEQMERDADNDELRKKKAQDLRAAGEQAAKDYDGEKPTPENVDKLAKQLGSNDNRERQDAEQRIKDWEKDQQTKKDLEEKNDELRKKDPAAADRVKDAMTKAEQARSGDQSPKLDEKQLQEMAKNLNGSDEKAKADAQKQLERMAKDPKAAKEAQENLQEMADKAPDGSKEQQDLKNAADQAGKMAKELAKSDNPPKTSPKIDPKELEKAAKQLANADEKTKQQARDQLKEMMKDPKAREQAQEMLKDMANNAKSPEDKQALENAAKQAEQIAKDMGDKETPKINPQDLKDLAKQMAGNDEKAKEQARQKMQDLMKDPKTRDQAKQMLEEMAKNGKNTPEGAEALKEAMRQAAEMAKNQPPKIDPKDLEDLAKKFEQMDPKAKEELQKKVQEAMKDEKFREEMKKKAEEMAKNATPEQKKQFDDMMRQMAGADYKYESNPDKADPRNRLKAAELLLEDFKKKMEDKEFKHYLKWTDEQVAQWVKDQEAAIAALRKQAAKNDWRTGGTTPSPLERGGPTSVKLDPKDSKDSLGGGRFAPPPGYADPYKKFTGGPTAEPKR